MYKRKKICQVIAAFNEEEHISGVVQEVPKFVDLIVAVDDCSTDGTHSILKKIKDPRLLIVRHNVNQGVGGTVVSGHKVAIAKGMDITVATPGDGQTDPKYMPALLDAIIDEGYDYAKGNRFSSLGTLKGMPPLRILGSALLIFPNAFASGYWNLMDPMHGYTALKVSTLKKLDLDKIGKRYEFENDMLIKLNIIGARVKEVPIPARYGTEKSKIRLASYIPDTSLFLLKGFFYRIKEKYVKRLL